MKSGLPAIGSVVQITARKMKGDKSQPHIKVGKAFYIKGHDTLQNGKVDVLVVAHPNNPKRTLRCNSARFDWKEISPSQIQEIQFKEEVAKETQMIRDSFTFEEHMQVAFVPLIITHIAWQYADKTCDKAAAYKVDCTKKLTRAVRTLHREYDSFIAKDLDPDHRRHIFQQAQEFIKGCQNDFTIMWFTLNNEVNKAYINAPYNDMRTDAAIGELLCEAYINHSKRMDEIITQRLGKGHRTVADPKIVALKDCMNAFVGAIDLPRTELVNRCMAIFDKNLRRMRFTLPEGEQK